jgi:HprK-related kinase A
LSDELTLISPETGKVTPLPRPVSLKNQSIAVMRAFAPNAVFNAPVHDTIKGSVAHMRPPLEALQRSDELAMPGWVVLPKYVAGSTAQLTPLSRARGLMALIENAFNFNLHGKRAFETLGDFVDASSCYEFSYSQLDDAVNIFEQLADGKLP